MSADPGLQVPDAPPSPLVGRLTRLAGGIGLLALSVGALVLLSWLFGVQPRLPMLPFTALCFALLGLALWLSSRPPAARYVRLAVSACATVVVVTAGLMLLERLLGVDLGIDGLLFREALVESSSATPGRLSLATSLCLACFGLALLLLDTALPGGQRPAQMLVL